MFTANKNNNKISYKKSDTKQKSKYMQTVIEQQLYPPSIISKDSDILPIYGDDDTG